MIPRVPADIREQIIHLRGQRLTFSEIGRATGIHRNTVSAVCAQHFGSRVEQAKADLKREINLARAEAHTAPPFHPEGWG